MNTEYEWIPRAKCIYVYSVYDRTTYAAPSTSWRIKKYYSAKETVLLGLVWRVHSITVVQSYCRAWMRAGNWLVQISFHREVRQQLRLVLQKNLMVCGPLADLAVPKGGALQFAIVC